MALPEGYKSTAECWQQYPKLPFPDNIGPRGAAQKRARDACVAASMRGQADPELRVGPAILSDPVALWSDPYPYKERPQDVIGRFFNVFGRINDPAGVIAGGFQTGGDRLRTMAIGWRPPSMFGEGRFQEAETIATILGGLDALVAAEEQPWVSLAGRIQSLPQLKLRGKAEKVEAPLLSIVRDGAQMSGDRKPKNILEAAEYIRQVVINRNLAAPAWHARVIRLVLIGQEAQKKRKIVEQSVSTALAVTAKATSWAPPVAAILAAAGATASGAAARTGMEKDAGERLINRSASNFEHALQMRNIQAQTKLYEQAIAEAQQAERNLIPAALAEGEQRAKYIQAGIWVGAVGLTTLAAYAVATTFTRRRQ